MLILTIHTLELSVFVVLLLLTGMEVIKSFTGTLFTECTALQRTTLHCTALNCTAMQCTELRCIAVNCTALHCTK